MLKNYILCTHLVGGIQYLLENILWALTFATKNSTIKIWYYDILEVYRKFGEVSGLRVSLEKTAILGINTDPDILREITKLQQGLDT